MRILFAGGKERGAACLRALVKAGHEIVGVVASSAEADVVALGAELGAPVLVPDDINAPDVLGELGRLEPELSVLAGYGQIVGQELLGLAPHGAVNLHAGKLPQYRGSSPLNWALINGETEFTVSVIAVDVGVDTGDVLAERTFAIGLDETIADLHQIANDAFPELLLDVVAQLERGTVQRRRQDGREAAYYPLRFPEDGLILWDVLTAEQVHNRIRALTRPYPCAFTFHDGRRLTLLASQLDDSVFRGEPGRVYANRDGALLVCALDRCVWIREAEFGDGRPATESIRRYETLATVRAAAAAILGGGS